MSTNYPIQQIRKRDGRVVPFDRTKIENAVAKAARAVGNGVAPGWAAGIAARVTELLVERYGPGSTPEVEQIQDVVEEVLIGAGHPAIAKAYILYREQRSQIRATEHILLDGAALMDDYLKKLDWRVSENSNMNYSLQGLNFYVASSISARYWLNRIYPPQVRQAHTEGAMHIHDLSVLAAYTYYGKEVVVARRAGQLQVCSLEQLYEDTPGDEVLLNEADGAYAKYPSELFVLDKDGWTRAVRLVRKTKHRPMRFIKNRGGRSVIVTDNHPMIVQHGEKEAHELGAEDQTYTADLRRLLAGETLFAVQTIDLAAAIREHGPLDYAVFLDGLPLEDAPENLEPGQESGLVHTATSSMPRFLRLTEGFGYFVGFALAEGFLSYDVNRSQVISITQREQRPLLRANRGLLDNGISGVLTRRPDDRWELRVTNPFLRFLFERVFKIKPGSRHKTLPVNILSYNQDFVKGVIAGLLDGDGSLEGSGTQLLLRVAARTLLEQLAVVLELLGFVPRDRAIEGQGSRRAYRGREIVQNYPLYGLAFSKTDVDLPADKYQMAAVATQSWHDSGRDAWHRLLNNIPVEIPDDVIYDITTESGTLLVNGMWNHNCCGWDLQDLLLRGFGGVPAKVESRPPRHLRSALGQVVNFFYTLQGETAGAQAFSFCPQTPVIIRRNGKLEFLTLEMLFKNYEHHAQPLGGSEVIFTEGVYRRYALDDADQRKYLDSRMPTGDILFQHDKIEVLSEGGFVPLRALSRHRISSDADKLLIIETEDGNVLRVTQAHTMILSDGSLKKAQDLQQGDELASSDFNLSISSAVTLDEDFAWLIGILIAEGSWGHQTREYSIVSQARHTTLHQRVEAVLQKLSIPYFFQGNYNIVFGTTRVGRCIRNHLELQDKSYRKNLPGFIFQLDRESIGAILSGLIDGDGDVDRGRVVRLHTTSYTLVTQLKVLLQSLGIQATVRVSDPKRLQENQRDVYTLRFRIPASQLGIFKKSFKLQDLKPKTREGPRLTARVVKIYEATPNSEYVYDLTTDNQKFLVGNVIVHNSNFDTLLAPFIAYDELDYKGVKQAVQEFVYNVNVPTRVGFQSLVWDELVVVRRHGRIEVTEIGRLVDEQFARNNHRVLNQGHDSYAVANADDVQTLAFGSDGQVGWAAVKAFVRHRVPAGSPFVRVRTSRGTARVSQAHSLFAFPALDGRSMPQPMAAQDVDIVHGNAIVTPTNHFVAIRQVPNNGTREQLDLTELIDAAPQVAARVRVRVPDQAEAVKRLQQRVREQFGGLTPFYLEYGIKDKGCWAQWSDTERGTLPYQVWRAFGDDEPEARFSLRNSDLWYGRLLTGDRLAEFVRLLAWYITEGHNDITNGLYVSQARGGDQEEMARVLHALGALGYTEEMPGWSAQGNPTRAVLRMAGKGLLAVLIGYLGGTYSTNKIIPWFVYDLTPALQEILIATLLRGDASEFPRYFDYTTTSKKLSLSLSLLLAMNGYRFSVYEVDYARDAWNDQYTVRIYKDKSAPERYAVGDLVARVCTRREVITYEREYEYDLSVDTPLENFAGGSGLLCFHNTPFTNITMDLVCPAMLRDQAVIIGGELQDRTYGEFQREMDLFNRAFAEVMLEGDAKSRVFTFPIPTYNITADFDWENDDLQPLWEMTARYGIPYFANYVNSDMQPEDARSMCPLHPDTQVIVRAERGIFVRTIKDVYYTWKEKGTEYEVLFNGKWYPAKLVATKTMGCREIAIGNGETVIMDIRHEQPVKCGKGQPIQLLMAEQIRAGMYLPFNAMPIGDELDNYDAGFAVGAFLGDGSYDRNDALLYSLSPGKKEKTVASRLRDFFIRCGFVVSEREQTPSVVMLRVGASSSASVYWMAQFVEGRNAHEKRLTARVFQMGQRFLQGVLDGWYQTDGGNRGRIYTVSEQLCRDFSTLCGLLGKAYKVDRQGDSRDGRYGEGRVFTLKFHNRTSYGQHFFYEDGFWWYPVETARTVDGYDGLVYCFAVDSEEHLFQTANGLVTHNCRLRLDNRELRRRTGGLFAASPLTGSVGVVTLNMARIGYLSASEDEFLARLGNLMDTAQVSLEIKRKTLERLTEQGLYPYSRHYLAGIKARSGAYWANHFSTIGLNGMNEACLNFLGVGIGHPDGKNFALHVLDFMLEKIRAYQEETNTLYNLEASPAEGAAYRLARADRERYPDIITAGTPEAPYYSNSTHLPVNYTDDLWATLAHQDELQTRYTGGTVLHIFLGERLDDWRQARLLVRRIAERFRLPYYTLTPTFSICPIHGYIPGEHRFCPYEHSKEQLEQLGLTIAYESQPTPVPTVAG